MNRGIISSRVFFFTDYLDLDLISYYKFDEFSGKLKDRISDNDGTLNNLVTQGEPGIISNSYNFNPAEESYVFVESLRLSRFKQFSLSLWFKTTQSGNFSNNNTYIPDAGYSGEGCMVSTGGNSTASGSKLRVNHIDGRVVVRVQGRIEFNFTEVNDGNWHHLALNLPENSTIGDIEVFLDSDKLIYNGSASPQNPMNLDPGELYFGRNNSSDNYRYNGNIDEVFLAKTILSQQKVNEIYNNGLGTTIQNI
jgi:hypothetical protein